VDTPAPDATVAAGQGNHLPAPLLQPHDIVGQFRRGCDDGLLFWMRVGPRVSLAARRPMLREHDALVLGFGDAPMRDQTAGIKLNLDLVLGLANLWRLALSCPGLSERQDGQAPLPSRQRRPIQSTGTEYRLQFSAT
jgi:hypothetical protein